MKTLSTIISAIVFATVSFSSMAATEVASLPTGEHKIGEVSASTNSEDLSVLQRKLDKEATSEGATSYHITSAGGKNHLYGTADIYK